MNSLICPQKELWFVTGSQHLYGPEALSEVDAHSKIIVDALDAASNVPVKVVFKPVLTNADAITQIALEANSNANCIGLVCWMHTFSPAKMWIGGLTALRKPFCHLHTQFNRDIPWATMDMDFMNLNQSAHGGREFGFMVSRLRINRKIIVGHWEDPEVVADLGQWARVAAAWDDFKHLKVARFGDNMRQVAVTEGDKVEAQIQFGMEVNSYGIGDLVEHIRSAKPADVEALCDVYAQSYTMAPSLLKGGASYASLQETAAIELGLRSFLDEGGFKAFTDTFEDLHGMRQLPGLPAQRLMADGYGFGAEGDWKHSALTRAMKVMASGEDKGTSFMEDYTYHFSPKGMRCLGAHMLEICPSIAAEKPSCEIHPLGIGGKEDPVRLVFNGKAGAAINASVVDMGNRFRLLINKVEAVEPEADLPKLPVARVLWDVKPSLKEGVACWIQAGGAHHTCFSYSVPTEAMVDFAEMANIESVIIDENTTLPHLKETLRCNEVYYGIRGL